MKEKIVSMLSRSEGFVSGQELCEKLGVSRTAVWKAVQKLKEEGYEIEAVSNRGYCLRREPDRMTADVCVPLMQTVWAGRPYEYHEQIDSTNNRAKQLGELPGTHGTLVAADSQKLGKGRRGRVWQSPAGTTISMSLVLQPEFSPAKASMLTLVNALAAREAIERVSGVRAGIKWPNDLVAGGRKLCGILTEMSADLDGIRYVVIGTGINVNVRQFPQEIRETATSLFLESGRDICRGALIARYVQCFEREYAIFQKTEDLSGLRERYEEALVSMGKEVCVLDSGGEYRGICEGITAQGELVVRRTDGTQTKVFSGEVSVRGIYGYI